MSIGERIIELRKVSGLSQLDIARSMDISRQAVSKWENDISCPDAMNLIHLAEILDTDIEYLATGRRTFGRRPPVVITNTETIEKIVEKPVIQTVERVVERIVEKPVIQTIEKPIVKKVYRNRYVRNTAELCAVGIICFVLGFLAGIIL